MTLKSLILFALTCAWTSGLRGAPTSITLTIPFTTFAVVETTVINPCPPGVDCDADGILVTTTLYTTTLFTTEAYTISPSPTVNITSSPPTGTHTVPLNDGAPGTYVVTVTECGYNITGDMYGLGVRLGFYLQAASNVMTTAFVVNGANDGRSNSACLGFGILVAFGLGVSESLLSLEEPVFVALMAIVSLPLIVQPIFDWSCEGSIAIHGSWLALGAVFSAAMCMSLYGLYHGWDRGPPECDVLSGLGGGEATSVNGHTAWTILFIFATMVALTALALGVYKLLATTGVRRERAWIYEDPPRCLVWGLLAIALSIVCIISVELTIERQGISPPGLGKTEYGQWIAFSVGLTAIIGFFWEITIIHWRK